jgi:trigger factor
MEVRVEELSASRRQLLVQVPAKDVSIAYGVALKKVGGKVRIPGFRPGKAPRSLIERRYGSYIRDEVLDRLVTRALPKVLDEHKIAALEMPELAEIGEVKDGAPLDLRFLYEVLPTLTLGDWEGATVTPDRLVADDADLDDAVEALRLKHAIAAETDESAMDDDVVTLSYTLTEGDRVRPLEERRVVVGGGTPWLSAVVIGKAKGDSIAVEVTTPADLDAEWADCLCTLRGTIDAVRRRGVPGDEATAIAEGCESFDALVARERARLDASVARRNAMLARNAIVEHLIKTTTVEAPEALIEREISWQAQRMFGGSFDFKAPKMAKIYDMLRERFRGEAVAGVQRALVVRHLVEEQKIEATEAHIDARIEAMIEEMPEHADEIRTAYADDAQRDDLKVRLEEELVLDAMLGKVELAEGPARPWRARDGQPGASEDNEPMAVDFGGDHDHDHDHEDGHDHGHGHDHDHSNCDHDHDHDHA